MVNQPTNNGTFILVGVKSWSYGSDEIGCNNDKMIFANIAYSQGWINENIEKLELENTCD